MKKLILFALLILGLAPTSALAMRYRPAGTSNLYIDKTTDYSLHADDFNLICEAPCPFRKIDLKKIFEGMKEDFITFEKISGTPLPASLKPIDVHLRIGKTCDAVYRADLRKRDNAGSFAPIINGKGIICMYDYPLSAYIKNTTELFHELAHLYFHLPRAPLTELDVEHSIVSVFAKNFKNEKIRQTLHIGKKRKDGIWIEYIKNPDQIVKPEFTTMCDPRIEKLYNSSYVVCKEYGFDFEDIPEAIKRTQELKAQGKMNTREDLLNLIKQIAAEKKARATSLQR